MKSQETAGADAEPRPEDAEEAPEAEGSPAEESKKDSPVVPASPRGPSDEEGTHSDGSPEGSTGSGWLVVGKGGGSVPQRAQPPSLVAHNSAP